jgi:predicted ATP-dependent endonuclease of OLD family
LQNLKAQITSRSSNVPGIKLEITFDEDFKEEYKTLIETEKENICSIPSEYYKVQWYSFANGYITARNIPIKALYTNAAAIRLQNGTDYYLKEIIKNTLDIKERASLNISYRNLKEKFSKEESIKKLNDELKTEKETIIDKDLSIQLDISRRSSWETTIVPYLNTLPVSLSGDGEQNILKILLSLENKKSEETNIILIEEPENHLSFSSMNKLIKKIKDKYKDNQIILTTHSAFVINKLGLKNLILVNGNAHAALLKDLDEDTQEYFEKLPGYDTLRLVLSKKTILVEGASDELIVQKAYLNKYRHLPIEDGTDILSVRGLSFSRFLEVAGKLNKKVIVIRDNDGKYEEIEKKYSKYKDNSNIKICYSKNNECPTLEPQITHCNERKVLNKIFSTKEEDIPEDILIKYMKNNKTDCALKIFQTKEQIKMPDYIEEAICAINENEMQK